MPTFVGMRTQSDAAARRLAQLTAELEAVRAAEGLEAAGPVDAPEDPWRPRDDAPAPRPLPVPGRHASRREEPRARALLPEGLRGRVGVQPAHLAVVAVLVAVGVAVTAWWVVRADGTEVAPLAVRSAPAPAAASASPSAVGATPTPPVSGATTPATTGASNGASEVVVDVAGKVRRPGIVVLPPGSRVADALERAGGPRPGVSLTSLNLARVLVDGEQILVGIQPAPGVAASAATAPGASAPATADGLVNLNTADATQLEELPEVGPVTAEAIIAWRTENGGFTAVEELLEVDGIGEKTLATIAPHVTV